MPPTKTASKKESLLTAAINVNRRSSRSCKAARIGPAVAAHSRRAISRFKSIDDLPRLRHRQRPWCGPYAIDEGDARGLRLLITGIEALIVPPSHYFELLPQCARHPVAGSIFDGKPTSYRARETNQWEVTNEPRHQLAGLSRKPFSPQSDAHRAFREPLVPGDHRAFHADDMIY